MEYVKEDNMELKVLEETHPIFAALVEIQKSRTRFQLQNFVVGQHDTEVQQYKQALLEFSALITNIKITELEIKKSEVQIKRLVASGDEIDAIDADINRIQLDQQKLALLGMHREVQDIVAIWESFETKYTYEDIEADQPEYWHARLNRQVRLEAMGSGGHVGWASLDALRQIGVTFIEEEPAKAPEVTEQ
jgi:Txe/YoeB family toxin of Txe-Axe toxin-antitoxin module